MTIAKNSTSDEISTKITIPNQKDNDKTLDIFASIGSISEDDQDYDTNLDDIDNQWIVLDPNDPNTKRLKKVLENSQESLPHLDSAINDQRGVFADTDNDSQSDADSKNIDEWIIVTSNDSTELPDLLGNSSDLTPNVDCRISSQRNSFFNLRSPLIYSNDSSNFTTNEELCSKIDDTTRIMHAVTNFESAMLLLSDRSFFISDDELVTLLSRHYTTIMAEAKLHATKILKGYLILPLATRKSFPLTTEELLKLTTNVVALYNIFVFSGNRLDFADLAKTEVAKNSFFATMFNDIDKYNKEIRWLLPMLIQYISKNVITEMSFLHFVLHEKNRKFPAIDGENVTQNSNNRTIPFIEAFVKYVAYLATPANNQEKEKTSPSTTAISIKKSGRAMLLSNNHHIKPPVTNTAAPNKLDNLYKAPLI
jgi:hypothetical protein